MTFFTYFLDRLAIESQRHSYHLIVVVFARIQVGLSYGLYFGYINSFCQWRVVRRLPLTKRLLLYAVVKVVLLVILGSICRSLFHLWMDELGELGKALVPFYPSSAGMHVGSSGGQPPLPSPSDPFLIPVWLDSEENPQGVSHPPVHQQQDPASAPGQLKMQSLLEKHMRRHCQKSEVREKYPQLNSTEIDYLDFAKKMAISELDTDGKTDNEKLHLVQSIQYREIRSLLDDFLEKYFKEDGE